MNRVAYVKGIMHNPISASQLVGTSNHVVFYEEGNIISNKETVSPELSHVSIGFTLMVQKPNQSV